MNRSGRNFPGARRPPVNDEREEASHGRHGRPRRNKLRRNSGRPGSEIERELGSASEPGFEKRDGRKFGPDRNERRTDGRSEGHKHGASKRDGKYASRGPQRAGEAAETHADDGEVRFADLLMQLARRADPDKVQSGRHPEPLARFEYEKEIELKNRALQEFWTARGLPDKPNRILPSPRPRSYRTTTKRRVIRDKGGFALTFLTESNSAGAPKAQAQSLVEPREHTALYAFMLEKLNSPAYASLAHALNYLIIRGDYEHFTVLFNVHRLSGEVVRKAKLLGEHLQKGTPKVTSGFLFFDPSRSEFYFEARAPEGPWKLKKLFGPDDIRLKVLDRTYAYHPTSFCQVNASILPEFLAKADQLLKPKPGYRLIDLYCGFGFFTLHLGPRYDEALGIDLGSASIESAQKMAAAEPGAHCRFRSARIQVKALDRMLPPAVAEKQEVLLLDPPRQGTDPGVIRALAERQPARVLHIFCDLDTLPREVNQWRKGGYMVSKVVPLDMFPGTDNLEVMVLFIPDRYGILNRVDKARHEMADEFETAPRPKQTGFAPREGYESRKGRGPRDGRKNR